MSVEPFVRKSDKPADEAAPCALAKLAIQVHLHCLCQPVPTLLVLVGPDHVARCPYCPMEYFLSFLYFDCDKSAGQVGVQLRWREASGIVPATTLPPGG